jgi:hypothetical protein
MRKLLVLFVLLSLNVQAQDKFIKGYIVTNSSETKECFFDAANLFFKTNEVKYKFAEDADFIISTPNELKEFGIENVLKIVSRKVDIEVSSNSLNNMSKEREPQNENKTVFLQYLVQGDYNLLKYNSADKVNFYLEKDNILEQLIFKKYQFNGMVRENLSFKSQLYKNLTCNVTNQDIEKLKYIEKDITELVIKHNSCVNSDKLIVFKGRDKERKTTVNVYAKVGVKSLNIDVARNDFATARYFDSEFSGITPNIGFEVEVILPFDYNKVSMYLNPSFFNYKGSNSDPDGTTREMNLALLEVTLGARYYLKTNQNGFYVNGGITFAQPGFFNSSYKVNIQGSSLLIFDQFNPEIMFNGGLGYKIKDRFTIDLFFIGNANFLSYYANFNSSYSSLNMQLGYRFL